jgi:hypothetical protein
MADDQRACLVELRGTGGWTIVPPSIHPSGAALVWDARDDRGPASLPLTDLERAVGRGDATGKALAGER